MAQIASRLLFRQVRPQQPGQGFAAVNCPRNRKVNEQRLILTRVKVGDHLTIHIDLGRA